MDQAQQRALNALEPYVVLAKSANAPQAATQVVVQATSAASAFIFSELLNTPNIQELQNASSEQASYLTLLRIFAWGTWIDYKAEASTLPTLNDAQAQKLRQLSLITFSSDPEMLTYDKLQETLSLSSTRALEDLVISTIYAGLLTAKLDTLAQRVDVSSVAALRDLKPGTVPSMLSVLEEWDKRCLGVLDDLDSQVKEIKWKALQKRRRDEANDKAVSKLMEDKDFKGKGGGKRLGGEDNEEMDIDENNIGTRTRNAKRGGGMLKAFGRKLGGGG